MVCVRLSGAAGGAGTGRPPKLKGGAARVLLSGAGLGNSEGVGHELRGTWRGAPGSGAKAGSGTARSATVGRGPWERIFGTESQAAPVVVCGVLAGCRKGEQNSAMVGRCRRHKLDVFCG